MQQYRVARGGPYTQVEGFGVGGVAVGPCEPQDGRGVERFEGRGRARALVQRERVRARALGQEQQDG